MGTIKCHPDRSGDVNREGLAPLFPDVGKNEIYHPGEQGRLPKCADENPPHQVAPDGFDLEFERVKAVPHLDPGREPILTGGKFGFHDFQYGTRLIM